MLEPLIKAIQDAVKPEVVHQGEDAIYYSKPLYLQPPSPTVDPIELRTLTGLVDYLKSGLDADYQSPLTVHVASETQVEIIEAVEGLHLQRNTWAIADCSPITENAYPFGKYIDTEQFIIKIKSCFIQDEDTARLVEVVGNLVSETAIAVGDDGISQSVEVRSGVRRSSNETLPNLIGLCPYRTFQEVEQPESLYVFRIKKDDKGNIFAALFEAGGQSWKLDAMKSIKTWLEGNLEGYALIA